MKDKFIWTLWTKEWEEARSWDLLCLAVSIGFAKKLSDNVKVYTDANGAVFMQEHGIYVDNEVIDFGVDDAPSPKFAEAKLKTMSLQTEPFCHIDHDVFLLQAQNTDPQADIFTQSEEYGPYFEPYYRNAYVIGRRQEIDTGTKIWPEEVDRCFAENDVRAYNCGFVKVNNIDVCHQWCTDALDISKKFKPLSKVDNAIFEQLSLYAFAKYRGYKVGRIFDHKECITLKPEMLGYVHLMGAKDNPNHRQYITRRLIQRAKEVAPEFVQKCFPYLLES